MLCFMYFLDYTKQDADTKAAHINCLVKISKKGKTMFADISTIW